jgi:hypothetical protein
VTICDLKVLFHGPPKIKIKGHWEVPRLEGPVGKIPPPYMAT